MSNIRMRVAAPEALRMSAEPVRVVEAVSPKVSFENVEGGVRVTVQDVDGTHVTLIPAGRGEQGVGISSIAMNADYTLTITLDDGTSYTTSSIRGEAGADGASRKDGQDGTDGVSPSVTVTDITGGHRVTITDADGAHSFDVMNGETPELAVQDVQVNGVSVVTDGVANVPIADYTNLGVIKVDPYYGITKTNDHKLRTNYASIDTIKLGNQYFAPIVPYTQHGAAFYGLAKAAGDTTQSASSNAVGNYTEAAKSAIKTMLGVGQWELIKQVTLGEDSASIVINTDETSEAYRLKELFYVLEMKPSASTTTNTNAYVRIDPYNYVATGSGVVRPSATQLAGYVKPICTATSGSERTIALAVASNTVNPFITVGRSVAYPLRDYCDYFEVYTTGTAKFGAGTVLALYGVRA